MKLYSDIFKEWEDLYNVLSSGAWIVYSQIFEYNTQEAASAVCLRGDELEAQGWSGRRGQGVGRK